MQDSVSAGLEKTATPAIERRGRDVVARALAWLRAKPDTPAFLWIHLYDPHDPYDPPAELKKRFASAPYDGEIAEVDRLAGSVAEAVGSDALLAVAADHGEALGDHGESTHGVFLYDATLHVPLLVRLPAARSAGVRVEARVRLADLAPTILDVLGARPPAAMQGATLLPLLEQKEKGDRPAYAETEYPRRAFGWSPLSSWRSDRFLFVRAPRPESVRHGCGSGSDEESGDGARPRRGWPGFGARDVRARRIRRRASGSDAGSRARQPARRVGLRERLRRWRDERR